MSDEGTTPAPAGIGIESVPLKQRHYYYRGRVLRFRKNGFDADQAYWALKNPPAPKPAVTSPDAAPSN